MFKTIMIALVLFFSSVSLANEESCNDESVINAITLKFMNDYPESNGVVVTSSFINVLKTEQANIISCEANVSVYFNSKNIPNNFKVRYTVLEFHTKKDMEDFMKEFKHHIKEINKPKVRKIPVNV